MQNLLYKDINTTRRVLKGISMTLKKIEISDLKKALKQIPKDRYNINPFYVLLYGSMEDKKIFLRDEMYQNEFPFIGLPKNKKDWKKAVISFASKEELSKLEKFGVPIKESFEFEEEFYYNTQEVIQMKQNLEINGKLAGYNLSIKISDKLWIGLHQKVDYSYKGIGRFLMHERAKQFPDIKEFTLGPDIDKGIKEFKESLNPIRKEKRYFIVTK